MSAVAGVILAAGGSRRMGRSKQLLLLSGKPLVRHVAEQACAAGLREVLVVCGEEQLEVEKSLQGLAVRIVPNPRWREGQSTSLRQALAALPEAVGGVLFLLADQPLVDSKLIGTLVTVYGREGAAIVAPAWRGRRGNPVLFDLDLWRRDLEGLDGDQGARNILRDNPGAVRLVEVEDEAVFWDVDTPEDYQKLLEYWLDRKEAGK